MSRQYFGTDGVRGRVGDHPMTVEFALRLAGAAARVLAPNGGSVLIGKDTRLSGYMFEAALEAGFVAAGVNVQLSGPLPTPGVAYLAQHLGCDFGVVISASHNPYYDNGIKFFDGQGAKLSDEREEQIERLLNEPAITLPSEKLGRASRVDSLLGVYQRFCASTLPTGISLEGMKIVIDAANGAAYKVAPAVLTALGADIVPIGCSPNGRNINDGCGSTDPALLQLTVPGVRASVGIALDGDGDRLVMVDHLGRVIDGDQLLYVLARGLAASGRLKGPVVGTVMSNLGLEHALAKRDIAFKRAAVGDRYVIAMMHECQAVLGGETSGHILCLDKTTTGDGLVSALQVLAMLKVLDMTLAEVVAEMPRYPQVLINVRVARKIDVRANAPLQAAVAQAEARLAGRGRVVLRPSGTEPLIRVMVEGENEAQVRQEAETIAEVVTRESV